MAMYHVLLNLAYGLNTYSSHMELVSPPKIVT
jgi:hypothetical protein